MQAFALLTFFAAMTATVIVAAAGLADEPPTTAAFAGPSIFAHDVHTKESIVAIDGVHYRKVEYKNDIFYLKLLGAEADAKAFEMKCQTPGKVITENQVVVGVQVLKRNSVFIDGLRQNCEDLAQGKRITVSPNVRVGFLLGDSEKSVFKKRKLFWNPLSGQFGASGEW